MKSMDAVGVTFVNTVVGRGIFNGVVNISFGTFNFTPTEKNVDADPVIACRLRMDVMCAKQLRDALSDLIDAVETPAKPARVVPIVKDKKPQVEANGKMN